MGPFHDGELEVQRRAGVADRAERVGRIIHREIPEVARAFAAERRFVVLGAADDAGHVWATLLRGPPGFLTAPTPDRIRIAALPDPADPLAPALGAETDVGMLIIDPPTRRRMRVNGRARPLGSGLEIETREVYSNCARHIRPREVWFPPTRPGAAAVERGTTLSPAQAARLSGADTLFVASRHPVAGADVSHRGGAPGFVRVPEPGRVLLPDYPGNMMFNTLGNLAADPRMGVLLVDFERGDTLQLTGRATILWETETIAIFMGAERVVELLVDEVVDIRGAAA